MGTLKGRIEELERRIGVDKRIRLCVVVMRADSPLSGDQETMDRIDRALDEAGIVGLVDLGAPRFRLSDEDWARFIKAYGPHKLPIPNRPHTGAGLPVER